VDDEVADGLLHVIGVLGVYLTLHSLLPLVLTISPEENKTERDL
jgi:hypothetical protein